MTRTEGRHSVVETAAKLRALADRVPADGPPPVSRARQRSAAAAEAAAVALGADPTLAERQQRNLDLLAEVLRGLAPRARRAAAEPAREVHATTKAAPAHLGRAAGAAPGDLDTMSERCTVIAARITAAVLPDWDSPRRIRELSASRLPGDHELAQIADSLRRAVAPALDLPYPDPEAVRLADLAGQIALRTAEDPVADSRPPRAEADAGASTRHDLDGQRPENRHFK